MSRRAAPPRLRPDPRIPRQAFAQESGDLIPGVLAIDLGGKSLHQPQHGAAAAPVHRLAFGDRQQQPGDRIAAEAVAVVGHGEAGLMLPAVGGLVPGLLGEIDAGEFRPPPGREIPVEDLAAGQPARQGGRWQGGPARRTGQQIENDRGGVIARPGDHRRHGLPELSRGGQPARRQPCLGCNHEEELNQARGIARMIATMGKTDRVSLAEQNETQGHFAGLGLGKAPSGGFDHIMSKQSQDRFFLPSWALVRGR